MWLPLRCNMVRLPGKDFSAVFEGNRRMTNPWLKKNPVMSVWLSAAKELAPVV